MDVVVEEGDGDVDDALGPEGLGAADLEGNAAGGGGGVEGGEEEADGPDDGVPADGGDSADVDGDARGVGAEEGAVDAEDELVVPVGVAVAGHVDMGAELVAGVGPRGGVGGHGVGGRVEVLGGDDGHL